MKKYKAIIVLSKTITESKNGSREFKNDKEGFSYDIKGDPYEFRFKAVKKLFESGMCSDFILMGGEVEVLRDGKKAKFIGREGNTIPKAEVMRHALSNYYQIPEENLVVLKSDSNTLSNGKEIANYFASKNITDHDKIGILTNFYDLPRTMKLFAEEAGLFLTPICAEGVIYDEEYDVIKDFYNSREIISQIIGETKDSISEIKGMHDKEMGIYVSRFK